MNYSTAILLINPHVRVIEAIYEPDTESRKSPRIFFKTLDPTISVDDYVLVPTETRHKMTVNKVVAVDVDIDPDSGANVQWVISTVDRTAYENTLKEEKRALDMIKASEKTAQRKALRDKMLAHVDEAQLAALQIARMTGDGIDAIALPAAPVPPKPRDPGQNGPIF